MFDTLVGTLSLLLDFATNARTVHLESKTGCKRLTKCYYELENLVLVSERMVNRLDNLPMGRKTSWADFLSTFEKELAVFNKSLDDFLKAYDEVDQIFRIHQPELDKFAKRIIHAKKQIFIRTFGSWFDEKSLTMDEQKLRVKVMSLGEKVSEKMPIQPSERITYIDWEMDISSISSKHEVVRRAKENLAEIVLLKEQLREFIAAKCSVNDIL
jgi:hypothetical protein